MKDLIHIKQSQHLLDLRIEECNAVSKQLGETSDEQEKLILGRKQESLWNEIDKLELEIKEKISDELITTLKDVQFGQWQKVYEIVKNKSFVTTRPKTIKEAIKALEIMKSDRFSYSSLFNFVAYFLLPDIDLIEAAVQVRLQNWLTEELTKKSDLTIEGILADTEQLYQEKINLNTQFPHLLFLLKLRGEDRYNIEAVLVRSEENYDARLGLGVIPEYDPFDNFREEQESKGFGKTQIPGILINCLNTAAKHIEDLPSLTLQVFLPATELNTLAIDQFPINQTDDPESVGSQYKTVFRISERLEDNYSQYSSYWAKRWEKLQKLCQDCQDDRDADDKEVQTEKNLALFIEYPNPDLDCATPKNSPKRLKMSRIS
ncbi:MAG: hypothetical protein ACO3NK_05910 [Prochlorotrichaceae cyanobacterium]|jgi:hypothetical protein